MSFCQASTPVRCAHPSFKTHKHEKGCATPLPPRSFDASLTSPEINKYMSGIRTQDARISDMCSTAACMAHPGHKAVIKAKIAVFGTICQFLYSLNISCL